MRPIERTNDFVVKFANVNGSGSASANGLFAKAVLRMGVPVAARNIFPSNIQGMPTWYEVRVVEAGWRGRRGGVDLMIAMNPETWTADLAEIEPGGYLLYDATKPIAKERWRGDVPAVGGACHLLNTAIEADYAQPAMRERARRAMDSWYQLTLRVVAKGVERGEIRPMSDPDAVRTVMISALEGAIMLSRLYGDPAYIRRTVDHLTGYVEGLRLE